METDILSHDAQIGIEDYRKLPRHPIYLVLDNLRSAFNTGAIFRTADAARIEKLMLCGYTAYPPHAKLEKTGMGTLEYVQWQHYASPRDAVTELKQKGIPVFALETTKKSVSISDFSFPRPVGLILGNEALGISSELLSMVDGVLEIPLFGFKNSLNVATACGITVFEIIRQWEGVLEPINIFRK